jgi:hypothetical protein
MRQLWAAGVPALLAVLRWRYCGPAVMTQRFEFDFSRDVQRWNRLFAVNPRSAYLLVNDGDLIVHFGPWTLTTTLNNIVDATITGPYRLWRVAGPARLSLADRGLTFATTTRTGLCLTFRSPVPGIDPFGIFRHPNLTVTVKDPSALATALGFTGSSKPRVGGAQIE